MECKLPDYHIVGDHPQRLPNIYQMASNPKFNDFLSSLRQSSDEAFEAKIIEVMTYYVDSFKHSQLNRIIKNEIRRDHSLSTLKSNPTIGFDLVVGILQGSRRFDSGIIMRQREEVRYIVENISTHADKVLDELREATDCMKRIIDTESNYEKFLRDELSVNNLCLSDMKDLIISDEEEAMTKNFNEFWDN